VAVRRKGNQQAAQAAGLVGARWYRAQDGSLVNLELAQEIEVASSDGGSFQVVCSYNDGSEAVLVETGDERVAWAEMERIVQSFVEHHRIATMRVRLGHG
jgi:hypothetical protein